MKKALIITRVSGFVPQFEMNDVHILQEMGYEVHYAANYNMVVYGKDNSRLDGTGIVRHQVDFERLPLPWLVIKAYNQIKKIIEEGNYSLIHCHMPASAAIARMAAQAVRRKTGKKIPVLYTAHGFHFYDGAPLKNWIYYPIEKYCAKYTDRLILINDEDYKRAKSFPLRGRAERILGVGMELGKFEPYKKTDWNIKENRKETDIIDRFIAEESKSGKESESGGGSLDIYEKYHIDKSHAVIVSVGELTNRKNNIVVIEAMKELKNLPITYLICGSGPKEAELKKKVKEAGLQKNVVFAGYVTDIPEVLSQADCFVFPSFQEGLPVAVMEAMAVGLPVIATKIRGITDLITSGEGGYLADDWNSGSYAKLIKKMFIKKADNASKSVDSTADISREDSISHRKNISQPKNVSRGENISRHELRKRMGEWNMNRIQSFSLSVVDRKMRSIYMDVEV
ncbi:MAG: glycosyltransferase [Lachnospiraceae bacterium]|nr:glycosyltransferase [Lachnospiraceae bacterium]